MTKSILFLACLAIVLSTQSAYSSYVEKSAVSSLNGLDNKNNNNNGKWHPSVAFKCGFKNKYLNKHGEWVTDSDKYATCMKGKRDILKYCKHAYPNLDITNIVEDTHYHKIGQWCKPSGKPCKWTHTVRPYKCIAGEFESEALLVPQGCHFGHVDGRAECNDFDAWEKKAHDECAARLDTQPPVFYNEARHYCAEGAMLVRSFALLAPCGLDMYSGVEFVCCPKKDEKEEEQDKPVAAAHLLGEDKESRGPQPTSKTTAKPEVDDQSMSVESESNEDDDGEDDPYYDDDDESLDSDDEASDETSDDDDDEASDENSDDDEASDDDDDDDDEASDDDDVSSEEEQQSKEVEESSAGSWESENDDEEDPYFRMADPDNEHDNHRAAVKRLEERYRAKVNKAMDDWAGLNRRYRTMKAKDPEAAEQYKKENMIAFQKTISALEDENRDERRQLDDVHQERVQATLNERKRMTIKEYRDALAESIDVINPHKVLKTLQQYIRSEEKDRRHSLNRFKHLLKTGDARFIDYETDLLRKLRDIDLRINGTIAMLQDLPKIKEKVHPIIIEFWTTFRKENSPDVRDESVIGIHGQEQNRRLVQHYKSLFQQPIQDSDPIVAIEMGEESSPPQPKVEGSLILEDTSNNNKNEKNGELEEMEDIASFSAHRQAEEHFNQPSYTENSKAITQAGSHTSLILGVAATVLMVALMIGIVLVKRSPKEYQGVPQGENGTPTSVEVKDESGVMQAAGYENPTYRFLDEVKA